MEPEGSLPHSQVPATCPYPEPGRSSPYPHIPKIHLKVILQSMPGSTKLTLSLRFPHQNPVYATPLPPPILATCPAHLVLLNLITRTILCEQCRSLSCSVCRFRENCSCTETVIRTDFLPTVTKTHCISPPRMLTPSFIQHELK